MFQFDFLPPHRLAIDIESVDVTEPIHATSDYQTVKGHFSGAMGRIRKFISVPMAKDMHKAIRDFIVNVNNTNNEGKQNTQSVILSPFPSNILLFFLFLDWKEKVKNLGAKHFEKFDIGSYGEIGSFPGKQERMNSLFMNF